MASENISILNHIVLTQEKAHMNASEQTNDVWEMFTETVTIKYSEEVTTTNNRTGVRNQDGFSLVREKCTIVGKFETFLARGNFGEFQFAAHRWDELNEKATSVCIVKTRFYSHDWIINEADNRKMILFHSKAIESALLHFPPTETHLNLLIKKVYFNLTAYPEPEKLVTAKELNNG
jgi:hypothetical protein